MLLVVAYDFWVTLIINNPLYGSIPSIKEVFMAKFNVLFNTAVKTSHAVLSHWVTKASLLALGIWCFPPRPYAHSCISEANNWFKPFAALTRDRLKPAP